MPTDNHPFPYLESILQYATREVLFEEAHDELVESFNPNDLSKLARVHEMIVAAKSEHAVSSWYRSTEKLPSNDPRKKDGNDALYLMYLFEILHDAGVPPFSERLVKYQQFEENSITDWSFLPAKFRWIVDAINELALIPANSKAQTQKLKQVGDQLLPDVHEFYSIMAKLDSSMYTKLDELESLLRRLEDVC